jgi:hypothetical protein
MAFRVSGVENFAQDKGYDDIAAILARAKVASDEFMAGSTDWPEPVFSGGKIEHVLGSKDRVVDYLQTRETNLERYT